MDKEISMNISLDVWGTLVTPNPLFSQKRNEYLNSYTDKSYEEVSEIYTQLKHELDTSNSMEAPSLYENYTVLLERLGIPYFSKMKIIQDIQNLFYQHPPFIDNSVIYELNRLSNRYSFHIISNTNFISGSVIEPFLRIRTGINFEVCYFSDLVGYQKPSKEIFEKVRDSVIGDITHIGNDLICDGACGQYGYKYIHIDKLYNLRDALRDIK